MKNRRKADPPPRYEAAVVVEMK